MKTFKNITVLSIQDAPNVSEQPDNPDPVPNYAWRGLQGFSKLGNKIDENDMVGSALAQKLQISLAAPFGSSWVVPWCSTTRETLMLLRSSSVGMPLLWNFPGGSIKEGQHSIISAAREFEEETGLKCPQLKLLKQIDDMYFYRAIISNRVPPKINGESCAWGWFHKSPPIKTIHPCSRALLHSLKLGQKVGILEPKEGELEAEESSKMEGSSFYDLYDLQGYSWGNPDLTDVIQEVPDDNKVGSDIYQPSDVGMS